MALGADMRWAWLAGAWICGAPAAWACGGLFCDGAPPGPMAAPAPVDQNAERVLFEVDGDTVCATVAIQYSGAPDQFAWVVPVPSVPDLSEAPASVFSDLDQLTALQALLPAPDFSACSAVPDGQGCGCGEVADSGGGGGAAGPEGSSVEVFSRVQTIHYDASVIGAESAADVTAWLRDNGYNVSDNMAPALKPYADEHMKFVAVKLREGRTASDIEPLKMCYEAAAPAIPLRLTAVAAQPQMGVQVFIVADEPYGPVNFTAVAPDTDEIQFDANGRTGYFDWVARAADEADGRLFVAEYVGSHPGEPGRWISRFYTRLGPEHMTDDPIFAPSPDGATPFSGTIDLSQRPAVQDCNGAIPDRQPSPCGFDYCGKGARCAVQDGQPACFCAHGQVAQAIGAPDGEPRVVCAPASNPLGVTPETVGAGTLLDPCADYACGAGECVLKGGFATCRCAEGALAALDAAGKVRCTHVDGDVKTYGPGAGAESAPDVKADLPKKRSVRRGLGAGGIGFLGLLAWGLVRRRRR
jgi:hypothetical protein